MYDQSLWHSILNALPHSIKAPLITFYTLVSHKITQFNLQNCIGKLILKLFTFEHDLIGIKEGVEYKFS